MAADRRSPMTPARSVVSSVRARTTAAAVAVVGVALIAATLLLLALMEKALQNNVESEARLRAQIVAATLEAGTQPSNLAIGREDDIFVQIVDGDSDVLASSPSLQGDPPVVSGPISGIRIVEDVPGDEGDAFIVVEESAQSSTGSLSILVGRNLDSVTESTSIARALLFLAVPGLLIIVGATTWAIVGRALAPVEAIRREVAEISGAQLHRRVLDAPGSDEIARLARTMNDMLQRLESSQRRQDRLVSNASHELRNPIAAIRHHAEVALAHPDRTSSSALAEEVLKEDLRLQRIAEDLLLLAQLDEGALRPKARPLDLDDIVLEEARRLKDTTQLDIDTTGVSASRVTGDRSQLQRLVRNLADNAARYASVAVRLAVRQHNGHVVLEVDDDGVGVPPQSRAAVFERFARVDDSRDRDHGGAGLGLAIVAEIARVHGGSVSVTDAPLGGARFEVTLPDS